MVLEEIIGCIFIFVSLLIYASFKWSERYFSSKTFSQVLFHLKVPIEGTDDGVMISWGKFCLPIVLLVTIVFIILLSYLNISIYLVGWIMAIWGLLYTLYAFDIFGFLYYQTQSTSLYEDYYVDPQDVTITMKEKKNLIHICVESLENTYASTQLGGGEKENLMEELTMLAHDHLNFSHSNTLGGAREVYGTQWTIAGQVAMTSGLPLNIPLKMKALKEDSLFMPGAYSLGQILEKEGYNQEIIMGSSSNFGGTKHYFKQHGNYHVSDVETAKQLKRIPSDYKVFWGYEDSKLFAFAKEDILNLAASKQPFHMNIVTIDMHTPHGYHCDHCENKFDDQYQNVIACTSKQINEFVEWCKKQPFYKDSVIVITGDHLNMNGSFFQNIDKKYQRTVFNTFINCKKQPVSSKNREFTMMDLYPTILTSIGAKVEGERLGLGTNLFSDKKTVLEKLGKKRFNKELKKASKFYDQVIMLKGK